MRGIKTKQTKLFFFKLDFQFSIYALIQIKFKFVKMLKKNISNSALSTYTQNFIYLNTDILWILSVWFLYSS